MAYAFWRPEYWQHRAWYLSRLDNFLELVRLAQRTLALFWIIRLDKTTRTDQDQTMWVKRAVSLSLIHFGWEVGVLSGIGGIATYVLVARSTRNNQVRAALVDMRVLRNQMQILNLSLRILGSLQQVPSDITVEMLEQRRQDVRNWVDQIDAGARSNPEVEMLAQQCYSELTQAMAFVAMAAESKAKEKEE
ncbi:hypothetical protein BGZ50_008326 [Haplosporangium sp. Z 11]|nr:hypothetical protein BGZ50_008326 [Haplosporangium sp. Z 11]